MGLKSFVKRVDIKDIGLIKWSSILFTLFVVSAWSGFANWVISTHWAWFLVVSLILAIRPVMKLFR
ncbi:hypothetical protein J4423_01290 [Candidatus Pacearchaeota archaeon]|nr:hypothetical protein [Candidatus Pacearchaeota archaeon]